MLNLKDCQYPTVLRREIAKLIYPTPGPSTISGVLVCYIHLAGKIFLFGYMSWALLHSQCVPFCPIIIVCQISHCVVFPSRRCLYIVLICSGGGVWCFHLFGWWCMVFSFVQRDFVVFKLLLMCDGKNLVGLVWPGKSFQIYF